MSSSGSATRRLAGLAVTTCLMAAVHAEPGAPVSHAAGPRSIELVCGGGFTGAAGGRRIDAAGRLWRIAQPLGAPRREQALGVDAAAARRWNVLLDEAAFERLDYRRPGNVACTLSRTADGRTHRITWTGAGPPAALPEALLRVVAELRAWSPSAGAEDEAASDGAAVPSKPTGSGR